MLGYVRCHVSWVSIIPRVTWKTTTDRKQPIPPPIGDQSAFRVHLAVPLTSLGGLPDALACYSLSLPVPCFLGVRSTPDDEACVLQAIDTSWRIPNSNNRAARLYRSTTATVLPTPPHPRGEPTRLCLCSPPSSQNFTRSACMRLQCQSCLISEGIFVVIRLLCVLCHPSIQLLHPTHTQATCSSPYTLTCGRTPPRAGEVWRREEGIGVGFLGAGPPPTSTPPDTHNTHPIPCFPLFT